MISELKRKNFSTDNIYRKMNGTAQTVVLFDSAGKREIYSDFKDYQEVNFDFSVVEDTLKESDLIIACNSNFNRPLLKIAKGLNKPVATDVHVFYNIDDEYNKEFLENADILFMSDEALRDKDIRHFVWDIYTRYNNQIIVVGCGEKGALLFEAKTKEFTDIPSVYTRPVVSTSGAGDTLFSSFIHFYSKGIEPKESLGLACIAASYKIGEAGSSNGFWDETSILRFER
jgi:ribokinase